MIRFGPDAVTVAFGTPAANGGTAINGVTAVRRNCGSQNALKRGALRVPRAQIDSDDFETPSPDEPGFE